MKRRRSLIILVILSMTSGPFLRAEGVFKNMVEDEIVLYDFKKSDNVDDWRMVNDSVMGGVSTSGMSHSDNGTALFQGTVSLDNFGGFASTRTRPRSYNLKGYAGVLLRVKGDGKTYQFRIRTSDRFDGVSYRYKFTTEADKWIEVRVPFSECIPTFRGRILTDVGPVVPGLIQQIGFMITDKQEGKFMLEVDWVKAYKE